MNIVSSICTALKKIFFFFCERTAVSKLKISLWKVVPGDVSVSSTRRNEKGRAEKWHFSAGCIRHDLKSLVSAVHMTKCA